MPQQVSVSAGFRKNAIQSVFSITVFFVIFIALILAALAFSAACCYLGFLIVIARPGWITLLLGGGLVAMAVLISYSLLKFVTAKYAIDRSGLTEITREEQPELFALIEQVAEDAETPAPLKVFLTDDVNAAVFYDSSFRSMFLPVRKNLQVGMGLLNSVTVEELRAILGHEFGHFSQRSMKVGSYVYHVNKTLYSLLHENNGYANLIQGIANLHGVLAFFALIAHKIVLGIRWILQKIYNWVNLRYLALSREMEFHADAVAAHIAGSGPVSSSLLRLGLAAQGYDAVIQYYRARIPDAIVPDNLYPQHGVLMQFLASEKNLSLHNGLPVVGVGDVSRFDRSKLVIRNQWASHPSAEERVAKVLALDLPNHHSDQRIAMSLLREKEKWQFWITSHIFESVSYEKEKSILDEEGFIRGYREDCQDANFDPSYNGYYDHHNITAFDMEGKPDFSAPDILNRSCLLGQEMVDLVYETNALERDLEAITRIWKKEIDIRHFDYNGQKYDSRQAAPLITTLENELEKNRSLLARNDYFVFQYFKRQAVSSGQQVALIKHYEAMFAADRHWDEQLDIIIQCGEATRFMHDSLSLGIIKERLAELKEIEQRLKKEIGRFLEADKQGNFLNDAVRKDFSTYLERDYVYFPDAAFLDDEVRILFGAMGSFQLAMPRYYLHIKKSLLVFQLSLEKKPAAA
jgi:Zn-dependent protease with chaperone function